MRFLHFLALFVVLLAISLTASAQDFRDTAPSEAVVFYDFDNSYGGCSSGDTISDKSGSGNTIDLNTENCVNTTGEEVRFSDPTDRLFSSSAPASTGINYTWSFFVKPLKEKEEYRILRLQDPDKSGRDARPDIMTFKDSNNQNKTYLHVRVRDAYDTTGVFENVDGPYFNSKTHFAVTVEDSDSSDEQSTVNIYKNGKHAKTGQAMTSLSPDSNTEMSVGDDIGENGRDIIVDDVFAFDRTLTDREIQNLAYPDWYDINTTERAKSHTSHYSGADYLIYETGLPSSADPIETGFNFRDPDKTDGGSATGTVKLETDSKINRTFFKVGALSGDSVDVYKDSGLNELVASYTDSNDGEKLINLDNAGKTLYFQMTNSDNTNGLTITDIKMELIEDKGAAPTVESLSPNQTNTKPDTGVALEAEISDVDSSKMNITFYDNTDDSRIGKIKKVGNGTYNTTWTGLSEDQTYNYYVEVTDGENTVKTSSNSFTTIGVTLNWNDQSNNEDGFRIYSNASGTLKQVATVGENTESATVYNSGLEYNKNTTYKVAAYNQYGESDRIKGYIKP